MERPSNALMTAVLERCGSVEEATAVVGSSVRAGGCNLVVADAAGRASVIEVGHRAMRVRDADSGCAATNHFRDGEPGSTYPPGGVEETTRPRYETIDRRLPSLGGLADLRALLAGHEEGPMCQHRADGGGTISSVIFLLRERRILVTPGPPCLNAPEEFAL